MSRNTEFNVVVPSCTNPGYWHRHMLNRENIYKILESVSAQLIWCAAIAHGAKMSWNFVRPSASNKYDVAILGKRSAMDYLISKCAYDVDAINISKLLSDPPVKHVPPLPFHIISDDHYLKLTQSIVNHLMPEMMTTEDNDIPHIFNHLGVDWVPVSRENDYVNCARCSETKPQLVASGNSGFVHEPKVGMFRKKRIYLLDEHALFKRK